MIPIKDFPTTATSVFWELKPSEKHVFIACSDKSALTFVYIRDSINGIHYTVTFYIYDEFLCHKFSFIVYCLGSVIHYIGSTKLPECQIPLFLSCGDLTLETSTGKLNTITLSTHTALLMRPAATTLSHPTERLEQDLDKQLSLLQFSDAWKTCQLLNKKEYWEKLGMKCLKHFDIETGKLFNIYK